MNATSCGAHGAVRSAGRRGHRRDVLHQGRHQDDRHQDHRHQLDHQVAGRIRQDAVLHRARQDAFQGVVPHRVRQDAFQVELQVRQDACRVGHLGLQVRVEHRDDQRGAAGSDDQMATLVAEAEAESDDQLVRQDEAARLQDGSVARRVRVARQDEVARRESGDHSRSRVMFRRPTVLVQPASPAARRSLQVQLVSWAQPVPTLVQPTA